MKTKVHKHSFYDGTTYSSTFIKMGLFYVIVRFIGGVMYSAGTRIGRTGDSLRDYGVYVCRDVT